MSSSGGALRGTARRARRVSPVLPTAWRKRHSIGTRDGSIIAIIITIHMPSNDAAAPGHACPGIRIHAIDMVQPPGIGMPRIADMDAHQTIVSAALATKSNAETPTNAPCEVGPEAMPASLPRQIRDSKLSARKVV